MKEINREAKFVTEKMLYQIVEATGETLNGSLHIINTPDEYQTDEREGKYRVYHTNGYCFDIQKEFVCAEYEVKDFDSVDNDGFKYSFFQEWDGFDNTLTLENAIELIKNNSHLPIRLLSQEL